MGELSENMEIVLSVKGTQEVKAATDGCYELADSYELVEQAGEKLANVGQRIQRSFDWTNIVKEEVGEMPTEFNFATISIAKLGQTADEAGYHLKDLAAEGERSAERLALANLQIDTSMQRVAATAGRNGDFGRGMMQASFVIQDFTASGGDLQRGLFAIQNNIPMLVLALGGSAGLAGIISLVSLGVGALVNNWDSIKKLWSEGDTEKESDRMKELAKQTKAVADEEERIRKMKGQFHDDSKQNIENAVKEVGFRQAAKDVGEARRQRGQLDRAPTDADRMSDEQLVLEAARGNPEAMENLQELMFRRQNKFAQAIEDPGGKIRKEVAAKQERDRKAADAANAQRKQEEAEAAQRKEAEIDASLSRDEQDKIHQDEEKLIGTGMLDPEYEQEVAIPRQRARAAREQEDQDTKVGEANRQAQRDMQFRQQARRAQDDITQRALDEELKLIRPNLGDQERRVIIDQQMRMNTPPSRFGMMPGEPAPGMPRRRPRVVPDLPRGMRQVPSRPKMTAEQAALDQATRRAQSDADFAKRQAQRAQDNIDGYNSARPRPTRTIPANDPRRDPRGFAFPKPEPTAAGNAGEPQNSDLGPGFHSVPPRPEPQGRALQQKAVQNTGQSLEAIQNTMGAVGALAGIVNSQGVIIQALLQASQEVRRKTETMGRPVRSR